MNITNKTRAISTDIIATPEKPNPPAIIAKTRKRIINDNISILYDFCDFISIKNYLNTFLKNKIFFKNCIWRNQK
jgi:hypothetical protein